MQIPEGTLFVMETSASHEGTRLTLHFSPRTCYERGRGYNVLVKR